VAPGAAETICDDADGFVVQVSGAADQDRAGAALRAARADIAALATVRPGFPAPTISNVVLGPAGPLVRVANLVVDGGEDALGDIPELVVQRLEEAGIEDALVEVPRRGGPLDRLDDCPSAVVLRLFPQPAGSAGVLPAAWIDIACEWVLGDLAPTDVVPIRLLGTEYAVTVADAAAAVHQASLAGAWCDVVNGRLEERVRTASITFGRTPHVALAAGGPACDSQALLARFDLLCDLARDLAADVAYACVDVEPTFEGIGLGLDANGWRAQGGASPNVVAGELVDVLVPDAFPFQVLGKGHLARLDPAGELDPAELGEVVGEDRLAIFVGDPSDWLPVYDVRAQVQAEGFELLAPLLATEEEVARLLAARPGRQVQEEPDPVVEAAVTTGTPDLDDIRLEAMPHARRGLRLTFLELVAWLAHEPHGDAPHSVSPVLATYARWFASSLDDARRQDLRPRARALIGTAPPGPASDVSGSRLALVDRDRTWLATDWLVRVQAVAWLRLAGLVEAAGRLESIGTTTNHLDLVRAVDVLGSAIRIAGRRIELTASVAGTAQADDAELVEQAAWEAWEQAAETSGWVAASEAANVGIPAELAYTTDLRVIEAARDPRVREELEAARRSIGDTAWASALHAVADQAWTAGWAAAAEAIDAVAVLSLQTALDRSTRATARSGADDDAREMAVEAAEAAGKERLTRAALGAAAWGSDVHPWDAALTSAGQAPGGDIWASIQQLARAAVDDAPWELGMAAARAAVDAVLQDAPDLVARAVGASVAREAGGAAARGVAMRAAAVARAQGGSLDDAIEAARSSLASTAAELQAAAFGLLDDLTAVPAR
jgi:hypothetical protein